jgi:hypothetical protein
MVKTILVCFFKAIYYILVKKVKFKYTLLYSKIHKHCTASNVRACTAKTDTSELVPKTN